MTFSSYSREPKKCLWKEKRNEREGAERRKEEMRVGRKKGEKKGRGGKGKTGREGIGREGKQIFKSPWSPHFAKT